MMKILSFETSCDETAVAVIETDKKSESFRVLSNAVSSQVKIHAKWGGVVPNLAAREHLKNMVPVLDEALKKSKTKLEDIDLFSVTQGPGLIPALLLGTNAAKALAYFCGKPLLGIHHIEGHICSNYIEKKGKKYIGNLNKFKFPILALVISGGHTQLVLMKDFLSYEIVGQTQDDAVGEAYDKVAKILDLGYPGGPAISRMTSKWNDQVTNYKYQINSKFQNKNAKHKIPLNPPLQKGENKRKFFEIEFPRPMLKNKNLDFSFSGLKTAVLYFWQDLLSNPSSEGRASKLSNKKKIEEYKKLVCHEFENAVSEVLCEKSRRAIEKYHPQTFLLAGGVAANKRLRKDLEKTARDNKVDFHCPLVEFCGDNAAMIGVATLARNRFRKNKNLKNNWRDLEAMAQMELK